MYVPGLIRHNYLSKVDQLEKLLANSPNGENSAFNNSIIIPKTNFIFYIHFSDVDKHITCTKKNYNVQLKACMHIIFEKKIYLLKLFRVYNHLFFPVMIDFGMIKVEEKKIYLTNRKLKPICPLCI